MANTNNTINISPNQITYKVRNGTGLDAGFYNELIKHINNLENRVYILENPNLKTNTTDTNKNT
jgi:hypothetical protein